MALGHANLIHNALFATVQDRVTTGVAMVASTAPVWVPPMQDYSTAASLLLPMLGCLWLGLQIVVKMFEVAKAVRHDRDTTAEPDIPEHRDAA